MTCQKCDGTGTAMWEDHNNCLHITSRDCGASPSSGAAMTVKMGTGWLGVLVTLTGVAVVVALPRGLNAYPKREDSMKIHVVIATTVDDSGTPARR